MLFRSDGHHRYGTALTYRDWLAGRHGGKLPADHPANFVLTGFCAMEDPGLIILPTHRILENASLDLAALADASKGAFHLVHGRTGDPELLANEVAQLADGSVGILTPGEKAGSLLILDKPDVLDAMTPDRSQAFRRLAVSVLHHYLIDKLIAGSLGRAPAIAYTADPVEAVRMARDKTGVALITQPTRMAQMRDVCLANDLMPQKSTFFYPKLATGMVINPLE